MKTEAGNPEATLIGPISPSIPASRRDDGIGQSSPKLDYPGDEQRWDEPSVSLTDLLAVVRRRAGVVIGCLLVATMLGALYVSAQVPVYKSEARLRIGKDKNDSIKTFGEVLFPIDFTQDENFVTEEEIIKSPSLAAALVDTYDLSQFKEFKLVQRENILDRIRRLVPFFGRAEGTNPQVTGEHPTSREATVRQILKLLSAKRQEKSQLLKVGMEARDPQEAKELLGAYLQLYLDRDLREKRRHFDAASHWLNTEVERSEKQLLESITKLVKFTSDRGVLAMDGESNHLLTFFNRAAEELVKSKEDRLQLRALQAQAGQSGTPVLPTGAGQREQEKSRDKLTTLESEYAHLTGIYSKDSPQMEMMRNQIAYLKEKVAEMEKSAWSTAIHSAEKREELQQEAFERAKQTALKSRSGSIEYAVLKREAETNERLYNLLLEKSKELAINSQLVTSRLTVVDPPSLPQVPVRPKKAKMMSWAAILGLIIGMGCALAIEKLDDKARSRLDIDQKVGLSTLGEVPDIRRLKGEFALSRPRIGYEFIVHSSPQSAFADLVRKLGMSLFLSSPSSSALVVCSALPDEGKTFISIALATAIAGEGKQVVVVDTDMRQRGLTKVFNGKNAAGGLSSVLTDSGDLSLESVVRPCPVRGLYYLPAGPTPPNCPGLLKSDRMSLLTRKLGEAFDIVIFDCSPIFGLPDAQTVLTHADAAILVVRSGYTPVDLIKQARTELAATQKPILGVVLNMSPDKMSPYYKKYRYQRYYC